MDRRYYRRNMSPYGLLLAVCLLGACTVDGSSDPEPETRDLGAYAEPPVTGEPRLDALTPSQGPNSGGVILSLAGANFAAGASVRVGGVLATDVSVRSGTLITVRLPASPGAFGKVPVVVQNRDGRTASRGDLFLYYASPLPFWGPLFPLPGATAVASGDFDGDGKPDVAATDSSKVYVLLNNGLGGFTNAANYAAGSLPAAIEVGDWNGDQRLDLAIANSASNSVSILLGNGPGDFSMAVSVPVGTTPRALIKGDWNDDNKLDLAVANSGSNNVSILLGTGTGSFGAAVPVAAGAAPRAIISGDWNRDQKADLAIANSGSNNVSIVLGNGLGGFSLSSPIAVGAAPISLVAGDLNSDQISDLAVANNGSSDISILLGDEMGGFSAAPKVALSSAPLSFVLSDALGDSNLDLAITTSSGVIGLIGNGTGGFLDSRVYVPVFSSAPATGITSRDFNGDQIPDVVVATNEGVVLLTTSSNLWPRIYGISSSIFNSQLITGDLNGDRLSDIVVVGNNRLFVYLGDTRGGVYAGSTQNYGVPGPYSGITADLDGDQRADLLIGGGGSVNRLLGDSTGKFGIPSSLPLYLGTTIPTTVAVGDFNSDSRIDVVVAEVTGATMTVFFQDSRGLFSIKQQHNITATQLTVADVDGDRSSDIIAGTGSSIVVFLNDGTGRFSATTVASVPSRSSLVSLDWNGDQRIDLLAADPAGSVRILLGDGRGAFPTQLPFPSADCAATGDFNGDRKADLVLTRASGFDVILGDGAGGVSPPIRYLSGAGTRCAVVGDFNGDLKSDLVLSNESVSLIFYSVAE